jgi:hypothetical protein
MPADDKPGRNASRERGRPVDLIELARRYERPGDDDVNQSLVWALETDDDADRREAMNALVALDDLYAASNLFWVRDHSTDSGARIAAAVVLAALGDTDPRTMLLLEQAADDPGGQV